MVVFVIGIEVVVVNIIDVLVVDDDVDVVLKFEIVAENVAELVLRIEVEEVDIFADVDVKIVIGLELGIEVVDEFDILIVGIVVVKNEEEVELIVVFEKEGIVLEIVVVYVNEADILVDVFGLAVGLIVIK